MLQDQFYFLLDVCKLITYIQANGYICTGGELFRTIEQQEIHLKSGRSKTQNSNHLKRLAIDLNIFRGNEYIQKKNELQGIGDFWESLSTQNKWGGNYKTFIDVYHFERRVARMVI